MMLATAAAALAGQQHEHTGALTGRVTDAATSAPVEFATVALILPDSTFVDGTTTDSTGRFAFNGLTARETAPTSGLSASSQTLRCWTQWWSPPAVRS